MQLTVAPFVVVCGHQVAVEEASMTQMDRSTFTPQQLAVEKLIKEQNFTWKVRRRWLCGVVSRVMLVWMKRKGSIHETDDSLSHLP